MIDKTIYAFPDYPYLVRLHKGQVAHLTINCTRVFPEEHSIFVETPVDHQEALTVIRAKELELVATHEGMVVYVTCRDEWEEHEHPIDKDKKIFTLWVSTTAVPISFSVSHP